MSPDEPPEKVDWWEAFLYLFWGSVLTYFLYEPISSAVSGFVKSLLPSGL